MARSKLEKNSARPYKYTNSLLGLGKFNACKKPCSAENIRPIKKPANVISNDKNCIFYKKYRENTIISKSAKIGLISLFKYLKSTVSVPGFYCTGSKENG